MVNKRYLSYMSQTNSSVRNTVCYHKHCGHVTMSRLVFPKPNIALWNCRPGPWDFFTL